MNILASYRYQMEDHKKPLIVFYLIIVALFLIMGTTFAISIQGDSSSTTSVVSVVNGNAMTTLIFLFVIGLCTFKETFLMSLQNGISRKTLFGAKMLTMVSIAAIASLLDKVILGCCVLGSKIFSSNVTITTTYQAFYPDRGAVSPVQLQVESFFFEFFLALAVMAVGYFITIMFFRLNKTGKIIIGAGVPVFCFMLLPAIDSRFFNGSITLAIGRLITYACCTPAHIIISSLLAFIVFSALSFILMRRAVIKR